MDAPMTGYASTQAGQIAYQVTGQGPPDVLYLRAFGNVETQWDVGPLARFLEGLASLGRLIVFDRRGSGASDPVPLDALPTWEEWAEDILVVLDEVGTNRAAVIGEVDAGPIALLFAAMHPERTESLTLLTTTARYVVAEDFPIGVGEETVASFVGLIAQAWGTEELARLVMPSLADRPADLKTMTKFIRSSATPRSAAAQYDYMFRSNDTRSALPSIRVPALVLHRAESMWVPVELGRYMADNIAGARFVELPGQDVYSFGEAADVTLDEIGEHITGRRHSADIDRVLATVLFTDIVSSTQRVSVLGDRRWRELLESHDQLIRRRLSSYRGTEINTTGDGIVAIFDGPARAIRCACAIRDDVGTLGLELRAGLHTGEIERRGGDVAGIAVHIGARVAAAAAAGEVLVSRTVVDLVGGSGIRFDHRGEHRLKGIDDPWTLYAVVGS